MLPNVLRASSQLSTNQKNYKDQNEEVTDDEDHHSPDMKEQKKKWANYLEPNLKNDYKQNLKAQQL